MPTFVYVAGRDFDGSELPARSDAFGLRFVEGVPVDVVPEQFVNDAAFRHAVAKLTGNPFFRLVETEATGEQIIAPTKKRGRPRKADVQDAVDLTEPAHGEDQ